VGYIFLEEGEDINQILLLEKGKLIRSKFSVEEGQVEAAKTNLRSLSNHRRTSSLHMDAVIVDELETRAHVTGLLHSIKPGAKAFATVSAAVDPTKVWILPGEDFRQIVTSNPDFSIEVMAALSDMLRSGSKSLRGLLQTVKRASLVSTTDSGGAKLCRVMCFDATSWVTEGFKPAIEAFNKEHERSFRIDMDYTTERLSAKTATFAAGYDAVCLFVNDVADKQALKTLSLVGVRLVAMRCAGFDRVDTKTARAFGLTVARVPAYSPYAVAEMAISLLMTVNRKIHRASNRVKMANFTLDAGLLGMDIHGKTVGVMGTGTLTI
jgi:D-lactate dehydrogenase